GAGPGRQPTSPAARGRAGILRSRPGTGHRVMPAASLLWSPSPERRGRANVTAFLRWLEEHEGLSFEGYDDLWRWSVDELEAFWSAVWRFYDVQAEGPVGRPLAE